MAKKRSQSEFVWRFCIDVSLVDVRPGHILDDLKRLAKEVVRVDDARTHFDPSHWMQLEEIADGTCEYSENEFAAVVTQAYFRNRATGERWRECWYDGYC